MKKIFIGLILSITFLLAAFYLFIPGKIKIEETIPVKAALPAVSRVLTNDNNWKKWWPGETHFTYNGENYKPGGHAFNVIEVEIYSATDTTRSRMELALLNNDSTIVIWKAQKSASGNPFKRWSLYRDAGRLEKNMRTLLTQLRSFINKSENIYGFFIHKTTVVDSVLVSTRRSFDHRPGEREIDAMIQSLKKYISENQAVEKNYPMLNVTKFDSAYYEVMTAIPVDRSLPDTKEFATKLMLKGGNILEGEIRGGPHTIENAMNELETYRSDHQYTSPAIPYQLLVTDRFREPDTTKWITKLYYPVL